MSFPAIVATEDLYVVIVQLFFFWFVREMLHHCLRFSRLLLLCDNIVNIHM